MRTQRHRYVHIRFVIALAGDAKTNATTAAAKVSAAIPVRAFNGLSVMIFLRRMWKIPALTTSLPRSRRLRNPDQLRRRERYRQNSSLKGVKIGRRSLDCRGRFVELLFGKSELAVKWRASPRQFFLDCTIAMRGYDFRKRHLLRVPC